MPTYTISGDVRVDFHSSEITADSAEEAAQKFLADGTIGYELSDPQKGSWEATYAFDCGKGDCEELDAE